MWKTLKQKISSPPRRKLLAALTLLLTLGGLFYWNFVHAVTRTWDGGGTDGTCGGAGTANNWSCAANWSGDVAPTASDIATFDGTSTKNATINANISVAGIDINTGYTGTITQSGSFTVTVGSSHYDQAAGTFTGGSGAITVNGAYTLSSGTFTSTAGVLQVSSTFTHTVGGTFNHNNGTVTFTGSHTTADVATSETFYNLTLNKSSGYILTISSGDTFVVLGTLTQSQGGFNTGTIELQGNMVVSAAQATNSATISFLVAGDQTITSSSGNTASLNIAKSSGTVSITGDLTVWGGVTISSGTFTSTSGTLTLAGNWIHTAGGTFNHNNGTIVMTVQFNSSPDVNVTETFYNFSKTGTGNLYMGSGDTFVVLGTLTHADGTLYTGTFDVRGNLTIASTADGGDVPFAFTGGNDQTYTDQGGNEPDGDITVNKSGGTLTLASNADWNATNQDLTITSGTLASSTYNLTTNNFTVNGGTFTGGSGAITVNGTYTLSGGTFTSTSGTFTVGNTNLGFVGSTTFFSISGGTFNHNNGTVKFIPSSGNAAVTATADVLGTLTLYNIIVDSSSRGCPSEPTTVTTGAGDTIIATNDFTLGINNDPALGGAWEVHGNVTVGNAACSGSTGTLTMTGTGARTYTSFSSGTGPHLRVNNSALIVSPSGGTTNLSIALFSLLAGTFNAPSGVMTVGRTNMAFVGSETFFSISGGTFNHNNGTVKFIPSSGNAAVTATADVLGTLTLYNIIVDSSSRVCPSEPTIITPGAGDTIIAANNLVLGPSSQPMLAGSWQVQGGLTIGATSCGGTATLAFTGGNDQTYTDQGGNEPDGDITVNKSGGTLTLASTADWNATNQDLSVTSGLLVVPDPYSLSTATLSVGASGHLRMRGTGDLTLAGSVTNSGEMSLRSTACGGTDYIQIRSSVSGTQRAWSGTGSFTLYDVDVKDMAGTASLTVYSGTNTGNNGANWTFSGATCPDIPPAVNVGSGMLNVGSGIMQIR